MQEMKCSNCGHVFDNNEKYCPYCGQVKDYNSYGSNSSYIPEPEKPNSPNGFKTMEDFEASIGKKNHIIAGLLGIFFGIFGVHKFYLGYSKSGIIMLIVAVLFMIISNSIGLDFIMALPMLIGAIEGINYLIMDEEKFHFRYVLNERQWF